MDFDPKLAAITEAVARTGNVSEPVWQATLDAGWTDEELAEAFAHIATNLFTNYFHHYAGTQLDVPAVPALSA